MVRGGSAIVSYHHQGTGMVKVVTDMIIIICKLIAKLVNFYSQKLFGL